MPNRYTLEALESASGVSMRTIKEWIRKQVLAPPIGGGRGAHYSDSHLAAACVIRHLRSLGMPLDAIRARISVRSVHELKALLPARRPADLNAQESTLTVGANGAGLFSRTRTLRAVELMNGLVLMVDAEHGEARKVAEEICRRYAVLV